MKTMNQKSLIVIATLMGLTTTIISCEEETELKSRNEQQHISIEGNEAGTAFISNGLLKEKLIQQAYEAYATLYDVEITSENTQLIDGATLQAWVKANEKNKHDSINEKNRTALASLANQGDVHALLVTAPAGAKFQKSVFVAGRFTAILITDIVDIADINDFWPRLVKVGVGFYGNGFLDPWGNYIPCICVEEYKIIFQGDTTTKCGRCPDDL